MMHRSGGCALGPVHQLPDVLPRELLHVLEEVEDLGEVLTVERGDHGSVHPRLDRLLEQGHAVPDQVPCLALVDELLKLHLVMRPCCARMYAATAWTCAVLLPLPPGS